MYDMMKMLAVFAALVLPVYGLLRRRISNGSMDIFLLAIPLTLSVALLLSFFLACFGGIRFFWPVWGFLGMWCIWEWRHELMKQLSFSFRGDWRFFAGIATIMLMQAMPVVWQEFPAGWDPACHALIAEKIRLSGRICADWMPFENLPMVYPQCFHSFAAALAILTGCATHAVLQNLHFLFSFPAALLVWRIAVRVFGTSAGIFAVSAYTFLSDAGNYLYFYRMGMLPTECANVIFLGEILLLLNRDWDSRWKWLLSALAGAGIWIVHPLSGVIASSIAVAVVLFCSDRSFRKTLAWGGVGAFIAMGIYGIIVAGRVSPDNTESIRFAEEPAMPVLNVLNDIHIYVFLLAVTSLVWTWKKHRDPEICLGRIWLGVLVGVFLLMEYFFRYCIARPFFGEDFTIGIPSRFIAVSGSIFCIWAGAGLAKLSRLRYGWIFTVIFIICCIYGGRRYFVLARENAVPDELQKLSAAVRTCTPENAYFLLPDGTQAYQWFSYLAWRASLGVPIPSSENRSRLAEKCLLFSNLDGNREKIGSYIQEHRMLCMILLPVTSGRWQMAVGMPDGRFRLLRQELQWQSAAGPSAAK